MAAKKKKKTAVKKSKPAARKATGKTAVKKKAPKKKAAKKPVKKASRKKPVKKKAGAARRTSPMHRHLDHAELDDEAHGSEAFEVFRTYDSNDSGAIDRMEFAHLMEALGMAMSEEELQVALDAVDTNHSGRISWKEFKAWWSSR